MDLCNAIEKGHSTRARTGGGSPSVEKARARVDRPLPGLPSSHLQGAHCASGGGRGEGMGRLPGGGGGRGGGEEEEEEEEVANEEDANEDANEDDDEDDCEDVGGPSAPFGAVWREREGRLGSPDPCVHPEAGLGLSQRALAHVLGGAVVRAGWGQPAAVGVAAERSAATRLEG